MQWGSVDWFVDKIRTQGVESPGAYFSHSCNGYQNYRHRQLVKTVVDSRLLSGREDLRIGEVGCGTGDLIELMRAGLGAQFALGIDFVPEAIYTAKMAYPEVQFLVGTLPEIPEQLVDMDLIITSEVLYYLSEDNRRQALEKLTSALHPGGVLLFSSVLGERYFDAESANQLLGDFLSVDFTVYQHHQLYHHLVQPATLATSANFRLYARTQGISIEQQRFIDKHQWLLRNPFFKGVVNLAAWISTPVLSWRWLPRLCERIAKSIGEQRFRSNLIMLARKGMSDEGVLSASTQDAEVIPGLCLGIGFRRCGSSWLHRLLSAQPQIVKPENGLHFFSNDFKRGLDWYREQLSDGGDGKRIIEMSVSYGYPENVQQVAKRIVESFGPLPVFAIIRNPVTRAFSDYLRSLRVGEIPEMSFAEALKRYPDFLQRGLYSKLLDSFVRELGKEQIYLLVYENLQSDPKGELNRFFDFLGLSFDPQVLPADDRKLSWGKPRSRMLYSVIYQVKGLSDKLARSLGMADTWSNLKLRFVKPYQQIIAGLSKGESISEETRAQLVAFYAADVARLREEYGLHLAWPDFQEWQ